MTGRTHLLLGMAAGVFIATHASSLPLAAATIAAAGVASLAPDLDHPKSIISGYLPGIGGAARLLISHRGPTHTAVFAAAIIALLLALAVPSIIILAAAAGMASHLLADMMTPAGIPLAWPLSRRAWRVLPKSVLWASAWLIESAAAVASVAIIGFIIWESVQ